MLRGPPVSHVGFRDENGTEVMRVSGVGRATLHGLIHRVELLTTA
jgi:hypothetical protein